MFWRGKSLEGPIKITYMIDVLDTNLAGTENQLIKLINGLNPKRFNVHLLCFRRHPWFEANAASLQCSSSVIQISRFSAPSAYLNFLKLVAFLKETRPDIVHTFFPVANILGVTAAALARTKVIVSSRRDYGEWMNRRYLVATKLANRFAKKIVANSNPVKRLTEKKEKVTQGKVEVIYNGIDAGAFRIPDRDDSLKRRLNIPDHHKVVGIVANFRPMKRHYTFIKAAKEILKTRRDVSFLLIGEGPLKEETERFTRSLGIEPHIFFAGAQAQIVPFLSIMDVGVNCSDGEGLSNAIMEYMAAGVPCVVSNAGGNPDLIAHEVNGYTFELDDYQSLTHFVLKLLYRDEIRDKFARSAKEKIEREMSLDVILSKYEGFYEKLINA